MVVARLADLPGAVWELLVNPTSNLVAALLLYGVIGLVLLIALLVAIMFLLGQEDEVVVDELAQTEDGPSASSDSSQPVADGGDDVEANEASARSPRHPLVATLLTLLTLVAVWIVAGYSTSVDDVCVSCHTDSVHEAVAEGSDPHESTRCVACHEPGGSVGRIAGDLAPRVLHFADGWLQDIELSDDYGRVTQGSCFRCHASQIQAVVTDEGRGLRMAHEHPLERDVRCLDCHTPVDGIVAEHNAGMNVCLRCHDARQASADCETCHDGARANAARSRVTTAYARVQVPEVTCGGCHDEVRECDSCHGTRMPHTKDFMIYAHARAGAVDFWYNGGKACSKCHTPERRPCQKCHTPLLGKGHGPRLGPTHQDASSSSCGGCHSQWAYSPRRDFCEDVCHTPAAIRESPR